jgi:hypothetical protein
MQQTLRKNKTAKDFNLRALLCYALSDLSRRLISKRGSHEKPMHVEASECQNVRDTLCT